jgi:hypothetical protein
MITEFKIFEKVDNVEFSVGDIVTCVDNTCDDEDQPPVFGRKYLVTRIYEEENVGDKDNIEFIKHDKESVKISELDKYLIDGEDIETEEPIESWYAYRFACAIKQSANKYNL